MRASTLSNRIVNHVALRDVLLPKLLFREIRIPVAQKLAEQVRA